MSSSAVKRLLSGSTDGKAIKVAATSTPGTTIHTAVSGKLFLKLADFENEFSFLIKIITHQNAGFEHIHDFFDFFLAYQLRSCHFSSFLS